jgi:hypothetical protein
MLKRDTSQLSRRVTSTVSWSKVEASILHDASLRERKSWVESGIGAR